jgi:hypothetical protein
MQRNEKRMSYARNDVWPDARILHIIFRIFEYVVYIKYIQYVCVPRVKTDQVSSIRYRMSDIYNVT